MGNILFHNEQRYRQVYRIPEVASCEAQLDDLGFSAHDVSVLHSIFTKMKNYTGFDVAVPTSAILTYFRTDYFRGRTMKNIPLLGRLLSGHAAKGKDEFNFYEFVYVLWQFLACEGPILLAKYVFDWYARPREQVIRGTDILIMLKDLSSADMDGFEPVDAQKAEADVLRRRMDDSDTGYTEFVAFCDDHHSILGPAKRLQLQLRHRVLGVSAWRRIVKVRMRKDMKFRNESKLKMSDFSEQSAAGGMGTMTTPTLTRSASGVVVPTNEPSFEERFLSGLKAYFDDMNMGLEEQLTLLDFYRRFDPKNRQDVNIVNFEKQLQLRLSTGLPPGAVFSCLHEPGEQAVTLDFLKFAVLTWDLCTGGRQAVGT
jgi:hypothetical protein